MNSISRKALALTAAIPLTVLSGAAIVSAADFVGTNGNDRINGTNEADSINGLGGNDVLNGRNGNDIVEGGPGNDNVFGGFGADVILGGTGNDLLGPGSLNGASGQNVVVGGPGEDRIASATRSDDIIVFQAGDGRDRISCFGDGIPDPLILVSESGFFGCGDTGTDTIVIDAPGVDSIDDVRIRTNNRGATVLRIGSSDRITIVSGLDDESSLADFIVFDSADNYLP